MNVYRVNAIAAKWTIYGWFLGLAYFEWFAAVPAHLPIWELAILVVIGMFASSVIIGGGVALILGAMTKTITGSWGDTTYYPWGALISPMLAFFAARFVLRLFS